MKEKKIDHKLSEELAKLTNATVGNCARNVCISFLRYREILPDDSFYIEGTWIVQGQFDLHAWIESENSIIDPTYAVLPSHAKRSVRRRTKILCMPWEIVEPHYKQQSLDNDHKLDLVLDLSDDAVKLAEIYTDYPN